MIVKGIRRLAVIIFLVSLTFSLSACCKTVARIDVVRGDLPPSEKTGGSKNVHICPHETVTLGWMVSNDVTSASINTLGSVKIPKGFQKVTPDDDIKYTIEAAGECKRSDYCTVDVVKDGEKAQISAKLVRVPAKPIANLPEQIYWEASVSEQEWSPNIMVTSVRMLDFIDQEWNKADTWNFTKTNPDGYVSHFPVSKVFTTPWGLSPMPVVGNWKIYPIGGFYPNDKIPWFANFEVTMKCK